jgi:hypothetical protein
MICVDSTIFDRGLRKELMVDDVLHSNTNTSDSSLMTDGFSASVRRTTDSHRLETDSRKIAKDPVLGLGVIHPNFELATRLTTVSISLGAVHY